jgi:hypothetical protein
VPGAYGCRMWDQTDAPARAVSRGRIESVVAIGLLVVAGGAYLVSGPPIGPRPVPMPPPTQILSAPESSPIASPPVSPGCGPNDVDAVILRWQSVGRVRVATVALDNIGGRACLVWRLSQAGLYGNGELLIQGEEGSPRQLTHSGPGIVLRTRVEVGNYCGPKPESPVTVAFLEGNTGFYVATPLAPTDRSGVPPCVDESAPATITMGAWESDATP